MGKRKNIIIVLSVIIAVIVLCGIYTFARRAYYIDHPEYTDMAVRCTSGFRGLGLDEFPDRYAFSYIELYELNKTSSKSDAKEKSSKKYIHLSNYYLDGIKPNVEISDFEYYLALDYTKFILDLYGKETHKKYSGDSNIGFVIFTDYCVDFQYYGSIGEPACGSLKTNIFVLMLLTMYYSRTILPYLAVFYLILIFVFKKTTDGLKTKYENNCFIYELIRFLLFAFVITAVVDVVFTLQPIYEKLITNKNNLGILHYAATHRPLLHCEIGYITAFLQLIAVMAVSKNKKLLNGFAYGIPAVWMFFVQQFFLNHTDKEEYWSKLISDYTNFGLPYSLLEKINQSITFGKITLWDFADKLRDEIIVFNEFWPFYPKLIYFTLFFILAFLPFFISCTLLERRLKEGFCKAVVFAAANSLLVCMTSYVVRYAFRAY